MENINDKDYRAFQIDKSDNVATALVEIPNSSCCVRLFFDLRQ